jgi:hypothetical protein
VSETPDTNKASLDAASIRISRISRRRQLRLVMLATVAGSYTLDTVILLLYAAGGTTTLRIPLLYALASGMIVATFAAVFKSRIGEDADDPFLTIWQMLPNAVVQLGFLALAPEVGFVFLTVLFIIFNFGALRLTPAKGAMAWGATAASLFVVLDVFDAPLVIPLHTPAERWITTFCFIVTLGRCAATGLLGSLYRDELAKRTASLRRLTASLEDEVASRTRELAGANEELERLVAERTAEIKTLQGVLPICAWCKKIRDDRGAWNQLEAYISARTDVLFSHGICAECLGKQRQAR